MSTLPIDSAEPIAHADIKAGHVVGCVLTQSSGTIVWYGPFTVIANDRDADVIVVRRDHDHDPSVLDYFEDGDDLIVWPQRGSYEWDYNLSTWANEAAKARHEPVANDDR
jgi:hypothetical protein